MKVRTYLSLAGFGMLIAMFSAGCATTRLTSAWMDPAYQGRLHKIMVVGVTKSPVYKRNFEDEFVRQFKGRGMDAVASYTVMPDEKQGDNDVIAATMREQGADAVLICMLVSKKTVRTYVPGSTNHLPANSGSWRDYHRSGFEAVYAPGYISEDEYAVMETNLYDAANDKLIWAASSETEIQSSNKDQIRSYSGVMADAMAARKLLR